MSKSDGFEFDDSRALMHRIYVDNPDGVAESVGDVPVCPTCLRAFDPGMYGPVVCEDCWDEDVSAKGQGGRRYVTEHGEKKHYTARCPHLRGSKYWMTSDESCVYGRLEPCGTCGPGGRGRQLGAGARATLDPRVIGLLTIAVGMVLSLLVVIVP